MANRGIGAVGCIGALMALGLVGKMCGGSDRAVTETVRRERPIQQEEQRAVEAKTEPAPASPRSTQPAGKPAGSPPARRQKPGRVCCCDGSVSPTCTTVHRGCCSRHGGVCACQ